MELDEHARARLRALADDGGQELDDAARSRIAQRVAAHGPRVLRRARRTRTALSLGGVALVVGLAAVAAPWLGARAPGESARAPARGEAQRVLPDGTARPGSSASGTQGAAAQVAAGPAARACEQREAPTADALVVEGARRYALGALGSVVAAQGSALVLDGSDPCRVIVRLDEGRVAVHAADLGGGELRVVTPGGEVIVHGTVFAVEHRASGLTVDVDEGRVAVTRSDRHVMVDPGRRVRMTRAGEVVQEPLPAGDRARLRTALDLDSRAAAPSVPAAPAVAAAESGAQTREAAASANATPADRNAVLSADALVAEADALWRKGDIASAREHYRGAGALGGATAEAAWLALARRELSAGRASAARAALASYHARFPRGKLAAEALGIEFRAALQQDDVRAARRIAQQLQRRHPDTPQAQAAARWSRGTKDAP